MLKKEFSRGAGEDSWKYLEKYHEKTLKSPLGCKEIKPVNPKEINPEYSFEELMLKVKLQYVGCLMQRADSLEKTDSLWWMVSDSFVISEED